MCRAVITKGLAYVSMSSSLDLLHENWMKLTGSPLTSQVICAAGRLCPKVQFQPNRSPTLASSWTGSWITVRASFWTSGMHWRQANENPLFHYYINCRKSIKRLKMYWYGLFTDDSQVGFGEIRMKRSFGRYFAFIRSFCLRRNAA